jgi:hypothetical protein
MTVKDELGRKREAVMASFNMLSQNMCVESKRISRNLKQNNLLLNQDLNLCPTHQTLEQE